MSEVLASAIVGHLVGDYLLQNDWMALHKKSNSLRCAIHCALWASSVVLFAGWLSVSSWLILFVAHYVQDRTNIIAWWMRAIGQERFMRPDEFDLADMRVIPGLGPWSIIVVDNVWHTVSLWVVWRFLT